MSRLTLASCARSAANAKHPQLWAGLQHYWAPWLLGRTAPDSSQAASATQVLVPELVHGLHGYGTQNEGQDASGQRHTRCAYETYPPLGQFPSKDTIEKGRYFETAHRASLMPQNGTIACRYKLNSIDPPGGGGPSLPSMISLGDRAYPSFAGPSLSSRGWSFNLMLILVGSLPGGGQFYPIMGLNVTESLHATGVGWGASAGLGTTSGNAKLGAVNTAICRWNWDLSSTGSGQTITNGNVNYGSTVAFAQAAGGASLTYNDDGLISGGTSVNTKDHMRGGPIEIAIWDRELSDDEIKAWHDLPGALAEPADPVPVVPSLGLTFAAEFELRDASGTPMVSDEAPSVAHGTDLGTLSIGDADLVVSGANFQVHNLGNATLTRSSSLTGDHDFWVINNTPVAPGNNRAAFASIGIYLTSGSPTPGSYTTQLEITHNDSDESPFLLNFAWTIIAEPQIFHDEHALHNQQGHAVLEPARPRTTMRDKLRDVLEPVSTRGTLESEEMN